MAAASWIWVMQWSRRNIPICSPSLRFASMLCTRSQDLSTTLAGSHVLGEDLIDLVVPEPPPRVTWLRARGVPVRLIGLTQLEALDEGPVIPRAHRSHDVGLGVQLHLAVQGAVDAPVPAVDRGAQGGEVTPGQLQPQMLPVIPEVGTHPSVLEV